MQTAYSASAGGPIRPARRPGSVLAMDLRAIARAMLRQFPVVLLVAVVTFIVASSAAEDTQSRYEGRSSLLFVSAPNGLDLQGRPITVNPLSLSGNGERVASAAVLALSKSPAFEEQLRSAGATGDVKFRRTADAILDVKSSAKTPVAALNTLNTAVFLVASQLNASQAASGAPPGTFLKIETLATTDRAREIEGSPLKSIGAIVVVGIVVAAAAATALDTVAPNGFRSGARWVTRTVRDVGRRGAPAAGHASTAPQPRPTASPPPSAAPPPAPPVSAPAPPAPAPASAPSAPARSPAPTAAAPAPSAASTAAAPAPSAPTPSASTAAPNAANRQMRRQAAREASRTRGRPPAAGTTRDGSAAPRAPRST